MCRPNIIAEDETYYEANDIEFVARSNPMPIDDNKSNIMKISDIRSRRHSNVDSFQSVTENIEIMDYTEPEPIYENQENDYYQTIDSNWISTYAFQLCAAVHLCNCIQATLAVYLHQLLEINFNFTLSFVKQK